MIPNYYMNSTVDIDDISNSKVYIPSSVERKRSLLMYFLIGIIMSIWRTNMTEFEIYHLKQSIWFGLVAIVVIICAWLFIAIPYLWMVWFILLLFVIVLLIVFIREVMFTNFDKMKINWSKLFYWLWNWIFWLFYT